MTYFLVKKRNVAKVVAVLSSVTNLIFFILIKKILDFIGFPNLPDVSQHVLRNIV